MSKTYERIDGRLRSFIEQPAFFRRAPGPAAPAAGPQSLAGRAE